MAEPLAVRLCPRGRGLLRLLIPAFCSVAVSEQAVLLLKERTGREILRKVKALVGQGLLCIILLSPGRFCNNHVRHVLWSIKVTCLTLLFDVRQV